MAPIIHVTDVETIAPHCLRLRFEDGAEGEVDFSSRSWRGVFEPLADPAYFARVQLDEELGTVGSGPRDLVAQPPPDAGRVAAEQA